MLEFLKRHLKNEKGLSLVELLAVIVILGIVAAIAIPAIGNIIDNSRYSGIKSDGLNVLNGANIYFTDNPNGVDGDISGGKITLEKLKEAGYLESLGTLPGTATVTVGKPHKLEGTSTQKVNGHDVSFNATIDDINEDDTKGSELTTNITIQATP